MGRLHHDQPRLLHSQAVITIVRARWPSFRYHAEEIPEIRPSAGVEMVRIPDARSEADPHAIRVRLLRKIRQLLLAYPDMFGEAAAASRNSRVVRCELTVQIALIAARLYKARFAQVDHICHLLDELSEGRPLSTDTVVWLDNAIETELGPNESTTVHPGDMRRRPSHALGGSKRPGSGLPSRHIWGGC